MLRKIVLATGTFALLLLAYAAYRLSNAPAEKPPTVQPEVVLSATSQPATQAVLTGPQGLRLPPGSQAALDIFDSKGRLRYRFKAAAWQAISESELDLQQPQISIFMPAGQVVRITAQTGQTIVEPVGRRQFRPKRGWLRGNVVITVDRTTRQWRQQHPDRKSPQKHPEFLITVKTDSLHFDTDLSLIDTDSPVEVHSAEISLKTVGLKLTWNQPMNRLERLEMPNGGTLEVRRALYAQAPRRPTSRPAGQGPAASGSAAGTPLPAGTQPAAATQTTRPSEFLDIYEATFLGPVQVTQFEGTAAVASLTSDRLLRLIFTLGRKERQAAAGPPASQPASASAAASAGQSPQPESRLVLNWKGRLTVKALERRTSPPASRQAVVLVRGSRVLLKDRENTIRCQEITYDAIARRAHIKAAPDAPALITDSRGRYLRGTDILFDRSAGVLLVDGPGEACDPAFAGQTPADRTGRPEKALARWTGSLKVEFAKSSPPSADRRRADTVLPLLLFGSQQAGASQPALSPTSSRSGRLFATHIRIAGSALVQRADGQASAELLEAWFYRPAEPGRQFFGPIKSFLAKGKANISQRDEGISAESISVSFSMDRRGRSTPSHIVAEGNARAHQANAFLAAERIEAALRELPEAVGPAAEPNRKTDLRSLLARATGRKSSAITGRIGVTAVKASGNVRVVDPDRPLDIAADELNATLPDGRNLKEVRLVGSEDRPAAVAVEDYALSAERIDADLQRQDVSVPCPGMLKILVKRGLEGTELKRPEPLEVHWSERFTMEGSKNLAVFRGSVRATVAGTAVAADELMVVFSPAAGTEKTAQGAGLRAGHLWWQIGRLLSRTANAAGRPAVRRPGRLAVRREPVFVLAKGNAVAVSSRFDEASGILLSRLRLAGPVISVDLDRKQLTVNGRGTLLVEDYRVAKAAKALSTIPSAAARKVRLPSGAVPSQTTFAWVNGMMFSLPEQIAVFDGTVQMVHRSGSRIVLGPQLAKALGANVEQLRALPGRIANLQCENLAVRFRQVRAGESASRKGKPQNDLWLQQARLASIVATGKVFLREPDRWLIAERLVYDSRTQTILLAGDGTKARLFTQDEVQGKFRMAEASLIRLNLATGEIVAPEARIISSGD